MSMFGKAGKLIKGNFVLNNLYFCLCILCLYDLFLTEKRFLAFIVL